MGGTLKHPFELLLAPSSIWSNEQPLIIGACSKNRFGLLKWHLFAIYKDARHSPIMADVECWPTHHLSNADTTDCDIVKRYIVDGTTAVPCGHGGQVAECFRTAAPEWGVLQTSQ